MEKMPQMSKKPEAQEDIKSVLLTSEERSKRMTSEMAPENIEATFTIETFSKLNPADITVDDRGYVYTTSGNVYRIDRSRSRPNLLKLFNQNAGNDLEYIAPVPGKSRTIEVGKQMHYARLNDPDDFSKGGTAGNSTEVQKIEIWRNYLKAQSEIEADLKARHGNANNLGAAMAQAVGRAARGTVHFRDYTKKNKTEA